VKAIVSQETCVTPGIRLGQVATRQNAINELKCASIEIRAESCRRRLFSEFGRKGNVPTMSPDEELRYLAGAESESIWLPVVGSAALAFQASPCASTGVAGITDGLEGTKWTVRTSIFRRALSTC
jgi:hypothetical protein